MPSVTFAIALVFTAIALSRRNSGVACGLLIMSMMVWPEFLRVPVAIIQMSVPRFVGIALLLKFIADGRARKSGRSSIDQLVIAVWVWTVCASVLAGAEFSQISQMIGRGLDTVIMYFVARMALTTATEVRGFFKVLATTAVIMCILGLYEAFTWQSPFHRFTDVQARIQSFSEVRFGLLRAQGTTQNSIYFGLAMTVILGLLWAARGHAGSRKTIVLVSAAALAAALSSLSSGPWLALAALLGFNFYFSKTTWIKPTLRIMFVVMVAVEVASNRHFYHLIDYFALEQQTAWYRTRLLEVAVTQWRDYWIVGVGSDWPHHWAEKIDGRQYVDVVNNFVIIALYGGVPALMMVVFSHALAIKVAVRRFVTEEDLSRRKMIFGMASTLLAIDVSGMSVGLFGPGLLLSHMVLGFLVSASVCDHRRQMK